MDRVTDREFSVVFEATLSSTGVDSHGDKLPASMLDKFRDQMRANPELRLLNHEHNQDEIVGEIIDVWVEEADSEDVLLLNGTIGLFEGEEAAKEKFESDVFGGFSVQITQIRGME